MSNAFCETCSDCFEAAVRNGEAAREFYSHLAALFHAEPRAAALFRVMAQDETDFARILQEVRDRHSHSQKVHASAKALLQPLRSLMVEFGGRLKGSPRDLDEAWNLALDLERSVLREAFLKLTVEPAAEHGPSLDFYAKRLESHQRRLRSLGERFNAAKRRSITPSRPGTPHES